MGYYIAQTEISCCFSCNDSACLSLFKYFTSHDLHNVLRQAEKNVAFPAVHALTELYLCSALDSLFRRGFYKRLHVYETKNKAETLSLCVLDRFDNMRTPEGTGRLIIFSCTVIN